MQRKPRRPTPQGNHTGTARKKALSALQRRLRQVLLKVDWRTAVVSVSLCTLEDALGGSDAAIDWLQTIAGSLTR